MRHDLFDSIIQNIDVDEVPLEFIILAKVTSMDGSDRIVRGADLAKVIRGPERRRLIGFNVILDVRKIRNAVVSSVNEIYEEMNHLYERKNAKKDTDI